MPFETLLLLSLAAAAAVLCLVVLTSLLGGRTTAATRALAAGDFDAALAAADTGAAASREDLFAAAVAAKHLLHLDSARGFLERILAADPDDGEAWLELGLVHAYAGHPDLGVEALGRAESRRSDLAESLTLHRAWLALARGDALHARRLFEEIEAPLENKLRTDLGPGDPLFAEWFVHAAHLWQANDDRRRADWARQQALLAAPQSRLLRHLAPGVRALPSARNDE